MPSIKQEPSGHWRAAVCVKPKGEKPIRETKVFEYYKDAQAWGHERESQLRKIARNAGKLTFGKVMEAFLEEQLPTLVPESREHYRAVLVNHVLPFLEHEPIVDLRRPKLLEPLQALIKRHHYAQARIVASRIEAIFKYALKQELIIASPAVDLDEEVLHIAPNHHPRVELWQLPGVLIKIDQERSPVVRIALKVLMHTFLRTSELRRGRWTELVGPDKWTVPGERMKVKELRKDRASNEVIKIGLPHHVPLSRQVRQLLDELRTLTGDSTYMFRGKRAVHLGKVTMWYALRRAGLQGIQSPHGMRALATTALKSSRLWLPEAVELQMSHVQYKENAETQKAYDDSDHWPHRLEMMQWWSDYLEENERRGENFSSKDEYRQWFEALVLDAQNLKNSKAGNLPAYVG